jgi:hypothetical protein
MAGFADETRPAAAILKLKLDGESIEAVARQLGPPFIYYTGQAASDPVLCAGLDARCDEARRLARDQAEGAAFIKASGKARWRGVPRKKQALWFFRQLDPLPVANC